MPVMGNIINTRSKPGNTREYPGSWRKGNTSVYNMVCCVRHETCILILNAGKGGFLYSSLFTRRCTKYQQGDVIFRDDKFPSPGSVVTSRRTYVNSYQVGTMRCESTREEKG